MNKTALREMLKRHEGVMNSVYKDTEGVKTIGVGFNLTRWGAKSKLDIVGADYKKICAGDETLTSEQIDQLLDFDIDTATNDAQHLFPSFDTLPPARQMVLVNMAFNLGRDRLKGFKKMREAIRWVDFNKAADEMLDSKWARQVKGRAIELSEIMRTGEMP